MNSSVLTIDPTLPIGLVSVIALPMLAFTVWRMFAARGTASRVFWVLRAIMVVLAVIIVLRPIVPADAPGPVATGGTEVYFVVDTTTSMAAEDVGGEVEGRPGTRLDGVKSDIEQIATALIGAQFSLTTFDSVAQQRVPLTSDQTALVSASRAMGPEISGYSRGSSIDEALPLMTEILERAEVEHPDARRVLFYFGDGEQTRTGQVPADFSVLAPLLSGGAVLGYGTSEGGPMRVFDGFADDDDPNDVAYVGDPATGARALSVPDETNLRVIANQLRTAYLHRAAGEPIARAVEGIDVGEVSVTPGAPPTAGELYWIAALGLAALVLAELVQTVMVLARTRPRRPTSGSGVLS